MRNIVLKVAYRGTRYHGWQIQPNAITVEAILQQALFKLTDQHIKLTAASRTDSGVHANGQLINFKIVSELELKAFIYGLNHFCPEDIVIQGAGIAASDYSSRYHNQGKRYIYQLWVGHLPPLYHQQYAWWVREKLNIEAMADAAKFMVGTRDFAALKSARDIREDLVTSIFRCDITQNDKTPQLIKMTVEGHRFLYHMVRSMMGTLIEVGAGRLHRNAIESVLSSKDRTNAGDTAPGHGLILDEVLLDPDPISWWQAPSS